jgi:hypothetical protein
MAEITALVLVGPSIQFRKVLQQHSLKTTPTKLLKYVDKNKITQLPQALTLFHCCRNKARIFYLPLK